MAFKKPFYLSILSKMDPIYKTDNLSILLKIDTKFDIKRTISAVYWYFLLYRPSLLYRFWLDKVNGS